MATTDLELSVVDGYVERAREELRILLISVPGLNDDHMKWTILTQAAKIGKSLDDINSCFLTIRLNERGKK